MVTQALTPEAGDPRPMVPNPYRVVQRTRETADTWTIGLEPVEHDGFAALPGQFAMVYAFGIGEVPISISGLAGRRARLVHTVRDVGAVTQAICAKTPETVLGIRGPFGSSWPVGEAGEGVDVVLVAGGLGLAPLRPALYEILDRRRAFGEVVLLYGARTPNDLLYRPQLDRWARRRDLTVDVTVDSAPASWSGRVGVVPKLIAGATFRPESTLALVCGPEVMMRFTVAALLARGVAATNVYVSLERNMQCGIGHCGHCQFGPTLVCRDGPVYSYAELEPFFGVREL